MGSVLDPVMPFRASISLIESLTLRHGNQRIVLSVTEVDRDVYALQGLHGVDVRHPNATI
jgi:hypothetical protein